MWIRGKEECPKGRGAPLDWSGANEPAVVVALPTRALGRCCDGAELDLLAVARLVREDIAWRLKQILYLSRRQPADRPRHAYLLAAERGEEGLCRETVDIQKRTFLEIGRAGPIETFVSCTQLQMSARDAQLQFG